LAAKKTTLLVAGSNTKELCSIHQLGAGLEAKIKSNIHAIDELWKQHEEQEVREFSSLTQSFVNMFNELNRITMLWAVWHKWLGSTWFVFNHDRHWASLVIRGKQGSIVFYLLERGGNAGIPPFYVRLWDWCFCPSFSD
jgi:hypothetical protein